jgi:hypothetical protein
MWQNPRELTAKVKQPNTDGRQPSHELNHANSAGLVGRTDQYLIPSRIGCLWHLALDNAICHQMSIEMPSNMDFAQTIVRRKKELTEDLAPTPRVAET